MNDKQIEERNELFDSAVREQLTGYEPPVPHALWNRISSELDNGEVSDESTPIALHHEKTTFGKWKYAIAAAVLLTLAAGTLLHTLNQSNDTNAASTPIANKAAPAPVSQPAVTAPAQVAETKMVAQTAPVVRKSISKASVSTPKAEAQPATAAKSTEPATIAASTPANQNLTAQDQALEFAPVPTQNNPVEVGNVPMAALNFLSTPSSLNDEITVIQSSPEKKKKHGRKEESTRVIVLGKKFDSKPNITYQVPVRF